MSQLNASSYPIEKPTGQCAITGEPLEPGQDYIATLVEVDPEELAQGQPMPPGGLRRLDVSMAAWNDGARPGGLFSHWKSVVPEPNQKKKLLVDDSVLVNLFLRLDDTDDADRLAFRFVLGLILMRKRLLRYESTELRTVQESGQHGDQQPSNQQPSKQQHGGGDQGSSGDASGASSSGDVPGPATQRWWQVSVKVPGSSSWQDAQMLDPDLDEHAIANVTDHLGEILEAEL